MSIRIAVNGAKGRMGGRILALAKTFADFEVVGEFDENSNAKLCTEVLRHKGQGVLIDFSSPIGASEALLCAQEAGWGLVIGTTGLDEKAYHVVDAVSKSVPVVISSNMSIGVHVMLALISEAAGKLSDDFTVRMTEAHHIHKKDAPSGTALMLADAIAKVKRWDIKNLLRSWKEKKFDEAGARDKIGMKVIREGEIVGDHTVIFSGPAETIEITHRAHSRDAFARGALTAARFAASAKPGKYSMADVLK